MFQGTGLNGLLAIDGQQNIYCVQGSQILKLAAHTKAPTGQTNYQQLMVFGSPRLAGIGGLRPLILGSPSMFYGTTARGTDTNKSCLFSARSDGSEQRVLHFLSAGDKTVSAGLVLGLDGAIYGMNSDHIFSLDERGFLDLTQFIPQGLVALGSGWALGPGGTLFGTAGAGGAKNLGAVFRLNPDGSGSQVIHDFAGAPSDGWRPMCGLILGTDGLFYGTTYWGGTNDAGTVFRIDTGGLGYQVLHSFDGANGDYPENALTQGSDGELYGTASGGGSGSFGVVFKLSTEGSGYEVIYRFPADASHPQLYP